VRTTESSLTAGEGWDTLGLRTGGHMSKDEGLNPSVGCGFSRDEKWPELEQHAPATVTDPFTRSFSERKLDTANQGLIEL